MEPVKRRIRILAAIALTAATVALVGFAVKLRTVAPRANTMIAIGRPLPHLSVGNAQGRKFDLSTLSMGRRRVIAFYSPTCDACQKELPELQPFPQELELVMIREGRSDGMDALVAGFGGGRYFDSDNIFNRAFALPALPTLLFVDENGIVRDGLIGTHPREVTRKKVLAFAGGDKSRI